MSVQAPLVLDANLAVLLVVGLTDTRLIASHRNLKTYDVRDFEIIKDMVSMSSELLWCPHLLTEISNLLRQIGGPARITLTNALSKIIGRSPEQYVTSHSATEHPSYSRLGLTDAVLILLISSGATLLTADLALHLAALSENLKSINFAEIRDLRPDFN